MPPLKPASRKTRWSQKCSPGTLPTTRRNSIAAPDRPVVLGEFPPPPTALGCGLLIREQFPSLCRSQRCDSGQSRPSAAVGKPQPMHCAWLAGAL